ncbi:MAG: DUF4340 domain-containing protein, partial [Gemmatimonadetes bacterium]
MSETTLKRILAALVVVVAAWGGFTLVSGRTGSAAPSADPVLDALASVEPAHLDRIRIEGRHDTVELARSGVAWTVDGYPADSAAVKRILAALDLSTGGDVVATNPANHARLGVAADSAVRATLTQGDRSVTVLVGRQGPSYGMAYLRLPDQDEVVLLQTDLRGALDRRLDDFRDKTIVAVDTARVRTVEIERDGATVRVSRADSTWTLESGAPADSLRMRDLLREFSRFLATGFAEAVPDTVDRSVLVRALDAEGDTLAVVWIHGSESTRWATVPGTETVFQVPGWRADRLAPARER